MTQEQLIHGGDLQSDIDVLKSHLFEANEFANSYNLSSSNLYFETRTTLEHYKSFKPDPKFIDISKMLDDYKKNVESLIHQLQEEFDQL